MQKSARIFLLTVISISFVFAEAHAQKDLSDVKQHVQELIAKDYLQGLSAAYIQPDGEVQYFSFGDPARESFKFNKNTIYEIGSVSKTFTSLILARMVQERKVSLNTPIQAILPDTLNLAPYDSTKITLLHLATHTSGLPRLPSNFKPKKGLNPYADYTVREMYEFLDNYKPTRKPGTELTYSNLGVGLLGHLLALKSGMSYEHLLRHYITEPIQMNETFIDVRAGKKDQFAAPYAAGAKVGRWRLPPAFVAAGSIRSTASDMVTYLKAQMGWVETSFDSALAMTHRIRFKDEDEGNLDTIGLGWFYSSQHNTIIWHGGATGGYRAFAGWNTETQTGAIVLAAGTRDITDLGLHMLDQSFELSEIQQTVEVDASILSSYTGFYQITPLFGVKIFIDNGQLMAQATGQSAFRIYPESETRFFFKVVDAEIEFIKNEAGEVEKLMLYQAGRVLTGLKVEDKNDEE